eukprot:TRINITY_DN4222_c0_g1_i1.p1 TRINITY_DN4222_c0_g1~~TRINITY_DN4222_c0_g1_i1.p1  ORF type:complete len:459 (+),score=30.53 TRINITY_DN4222_c0_g1_i1:47-1423(+)
MLTWTGNFFDCDNFIMQGNCVVCNVATQGNTVRCNECTNFYFCYTCSAIGIFPIRHNQGHSTTYFNQGVEVDTSINTHGCDNCNQSLPKQRFHCFECINFDLCLNCFSSNSFPKGHSAFHKMAQYQVRFESKIKCNGCSNPLSGDHWRCRTCPEYYTLCTSCYCSGRHPVGHEMRHIQSGTILSFVYHSKLIHAPPETKKTVLNKFQLSTMPNISIVAVLKIRNVHLETLYADYKKQIVKSEIKPNEVELWYRTRKLCSNVSTNVCINSKCCTCSIAEDGFDTKQVQYTSKFAKQFERFGKGIYFSPHACPNTHINYANKTDIHATFLCSVILGNSFKTKNNLTDLKGAPQGFHSVSGTAGEDLMWDEYTIYNNNAALPKVLVLYRYKENGFVDTTPVLPKVGSEGRHASHSHKLKLLKPNYKGNIVCNVCRGTYDKDCLAWNCSNCSYDVCIPCMSK